MTETLAPRSRKVKILATLGPASGDPRMIRKLMLAGVDAFRINMSHGDKKTKAKLVNAIRNLEKEFGRPTTILFDLQGPKLRVGHFRGGRTVLEKGNRFIFDRDDKAGSSERVQLPHAELFESVRPGTNILIDDVKVRLNVVKADGGQIVSEVKVGGPVSDNKGVNVPDVVVPTSSPDAPRTVQPSRGIPRSRASRPHSWRAALCSFSATRASRPQNAGFFQPTAQPARACTGVMSRESSCPCSG